MEDIIKALLALGEMIAIVFVFGFILKAGYVGLMSGNEKLIFGAIAGIVFATAYCKLRSDSI